jgi:hypothetical protein
MKTSELTGAALDWAVAKCEEYEIETLADGTVWYWQQHWLTGELEVIENFEPSTDWAQGGPIIECEGIFVRPKTTGGWRCWIYDGKGEGIKFDQHGTTPLIAAMRCYVASKMGDEVEVPDELK